ncbi:MAG: S8 family serine peptidase, partial [Saprospiraceae bacterium]
DPFVNNQWSLNNDGNNTSSYGGVPGADMKVFAAWTASTGTNIKVAILDEGVDLDHPDLAGNMLAGYDATGQSSGGNMQGDDAHGTACAGIVASVGNNNLGTAGVAYSSKIVPVRIAYSSGPNWVTSNAWIGNALNWSWQTGGADVLSNSWGGGGSSSTINNAIDGAINSGRGGLGAPVLFAAGNDNGANSYPATYAPTISVIAMSMCNQRKNPSSCDNETWWGSNYGSGADIAAPGVKIYATDIAGSAGYSNGDFTTSFNGTSSACPNAAGVMALILAADPNLTEAQARFAIESTCDKTGGYSYNNSGSQPNGTWSNDLGYGRVNAANAVAYVNGGGPTCSDGIQNGDEAGIDCGGSFCQACPCTGNTVSLNLTFDNYPQETSWNIKDSNGNTVASGGTYAGQTSGSTLTIDQCLADGCYDFTIEDTYGDGICCGYGNGAYSLTDANGLVLASGGQFTNTETTNFCLNNTPPPSCDAPTGLAAAVNGSDVTLTWNAVATANDYNLRIRMVGVASWTDFANTSSPLNLTGLTACSDYEYQVQANCTGATSNWSATTTFNSASCPTGCSDVTINSNNFESGLGIWNDGGSDCRRSAQDASYANETYCVRLRDNTSTSTLTTDNLDLSGYEEITVDFSYVARSMDNANEDFWLQLSTNGGVSYTTVEEWNRGDEFVNGPRYNESVVIPGNNSFTTTCRLRFRCDASGNSDWIYLDDILISGCATNGSSAPAPTTAPPAEALSDNSPSQLLLFPNPAKEDLNIKFNLNQATEAQVFITDYTGKRIAQLQMAALIGAQETTIDVSQYTAGIYFVTIVTKSERITKKFVVLR